MINKIICGLLICFVYSCESTDKIQYVDIEKILVVSIKPTAELMNEIQSPLAINIFKDWLVFTNSENTADYPFYFYAESDLSFQFYGGKFGRGPGEIFSYNRHYWECTDSSFMINSDYFFETEFLLKDDSLTIIGNSTISDRVVNNLLRVNDSLVIFGNEKQETEYCLYNVRKCSPVRNFSQYPQTKISYQTMDDRNNILQKSSVINREVQLMASFYTRIPAIRFYDLNGNLKKEVRLMNIEEKSLSLNDFYNDKEDLYFLLPYATATGIFVLFINEPSDDSYFSKSTELQMWDWNGNLQKRYNIEEQVDLFCISSDSKTFYGLKSRGEDFYILKVPLDENNRIRTYND